MKLKRYLNRRQIACVEAKNVQWFPAFLLQSCQNIREFTEIQGLDTRWTRRAADRELVRVPPKDEHSVNIILIAGDPQCPAYEGQQRVTIGRITFAFRYRGFLGPADVVALCLSPAVDLSEEIQPVGWTREERRHLVEVIERRLEEICVPRNALRPHEHHHCPFRVLGHETLPLNLRTTHRL